ncbi:hypothetical protein [Mucilaginibacter sp. PPCGB 2223]|uniref:hypothetical protein n=1 Tax=Mucilaginibacter sp. PPCGB 2223 TaxID=1886027 RepID=UPI0009F18A86|nr:hypothetical protein [Mucilaginibacter sp. PPCGB 2223]
MIKISEVQEIHNELIKQFGGGTGVRDIALLEAAIARPHATFDGVDLQHLLKKAQQYLKAS